VGENISKTNQADLTPASGKLKEYWCSSTLCAGIEMLNNLQTSSTSKMGFKERSLPLLRNKRSNSVCKQARKEGKQKPRRSAGKLTDSGCVPSAGRIMEKDCELKLPSVESLENNGAKMTAEEKSCFFNAVKQTGSSDVPEESVTSRAVEEVWDHCVILLHSLAGSRCVGIRDCWRLSCVSDLLSPQLDMNASILLII